MTTVELPEPVADWTGVKRTFPVPLYNPYTGQVEELGGHSAYIGEVSIRQSDDRIMVTSVPYVLDTADDARRLAAALLAAAELHEQMHPDYSPRTL